MYRGCVAAGLSAPRCVGGQNGRGRRAEGGKAVDFGVRLLWLHV